MNENMQQALVRLVVVFLTAGVGAIGANLTVLKDAIADPIYATLVFSVITAVISAILKFLGGATQQAPAPLDGEAPRGANRARAGKRPNLLAI